MFNETQHKDVKLKFMQSKNKLLQNFKIETSKIYPKPIVYVTVLLSGDILYYLNYI